MARKDLLKGLMGEVDPPKAAELETKSAPARPSQTPRYTKGAIGAVSQSIAELKSRALIEITSDQIDPGGMKDRLDDDAEADAQLRVSLKEYGQQVPVLVRHDPNHEGRYQIVYGRRRVAALKALGMPVKAMVRDLTDRDLVIAQGQENTARRDLSFIEKVNFARQMRDAGYERKIICDALSIDKTVISRMFSIADAVPVNVITLIGPAPSIGRTRWMALIDRLNGVSEAQLTNFINEADASGSDARFEALFEGLAPAKPKAKPANLKPSTLTGAGGAKLGTLQRGPAGLTLSFRKTGGFDDWLAENITDLHQRWKADGK